ncbi:hypothetical protein J7E71_12035 [Mesobacillus foraminis]|uniref:hypothetical protein n=1 Tax=Mesobacillus foraminis TaxID=279826 RepID=UPI001BE7BD85|nr:hypothetical protein [Mesobacillus foraminis]MBT2756684.1 hypothetical protein [Mesobacillus foraminis]
MFRIRLMRGLRHPSYFSYELNTAETVGKVWKHAVLLILLSGLLFGAAAYLGISSEYLSKKLTQLPRDEFEMHKALFVLGQLLWGLFYGAVIIYIPSLFFWTLSDEDMKPLIVVQFLVLLILLLEKVVLIPISLTLGVPEISSPFSLGPIAQSLTKNLFFMYFFACISLFKLWAMYIQYTYLRVLTGKSSRVVLAMVIGINLLFWLMSALLSIIQFEKLI